MSETNEKANEKNVKSRNWGEFDWGEEGVCFGDGSQPESLTDQQNTSPEK